MTDESVRVLHVDDKPDFADMAAAFLERADDRLTVETVTSASDGLDRLAETDFDCVVSDYDMPETNGVEFLTTVREEHPDLPFILFTGMGSEAVASEAISAGVTDYLQKEHGSSQYAVLANRITNAVEQFRTKRRARRQRRQHRQLFDQAPVMYVVIRDVEGQLRVEDCNDRFVEKLGYDRDEVVGRPISEFYTEESRRQMHEDGGYERALSGTFESEERTLLTKDGETIETINRANPLLDEQGDPVNVQALYFDVTERKERERELELYETMIETIPDGVYALDEDLRYIAVNQGMADLTGYSKEELIGGYISLVNDETAIAKSKRTREELTADGIDDRIVTAEHTHVTADGEAIPCEVRFRALPPDDDGSFRGTVGVIRDISDRKEREKEREEYREYTDRLLNAIDDLFYVHDENSVLQRWNEALADTTGYSEEELASMNGVELIPEEYRERTAERIRDVFERGHARLEAALLTKDGTAIPYEYVADRVEHPNGEPRLVGIGRDISERKQRERALQRQNERLEQFASVISHDLRNPLNVAEGNVELAREECDSERLDTAANALERMDTLFEDLLTLAREGETVEDPDTVELASLADNCWRNVETADATLVVDTEATIRADRSRLQQVLENLVRNAVEHGGSDVTVTVGDLDDDRGFYVEDDGPGVPADERDDVFEYGYSTTDDGTGFGLAIVREIVEAHGWDVTLTESDSGGARFEITGVKATA